MEQIIKKIVQQSGFSVEEIKSRSQIRPLSIARQVYWYCLYRKGLTYQAIGEIFGRKHPVVRSGVISITNLLETNDSLITPYKEIIQEIKQRKN